MQQHLNLNHLHVQGRVVSEERKARGGGQQSIRNVDRHKHGGEILSQVEAAFAEADDANAHVELAEELRATGVVLELQGSEAEFGLRLDSLTQLTRSKKTPKKPRWLLLNQHAATATSPESATIWVANEHRAAFIKLFQQYLEENTPSGKPKNNALVANIARIQRAFLEQLWTSGTLPERGSLTWWELWLDTRRERPGLLERVLEAFNIERLEQQTRIGESLITYAHATWEQLERLTATDLPLTEVREPSFVIETIEDISAPEQEEYVQDLEGRITSAPYGAPSVCHLDTGVFRGHLLLADSLDSVDQHWVVGSDGHDYRGHGTTMAGLTLYGSHLDQLLLGTMQLRLTHRLESVKMLDKGQSGAKSSRPQTWANNTIQAVALPEIQAPQRRRTFCMPLSAKSDTAPGTPTLWSAAIDALAAGTDIVVSNNSISLLTAPQPDAARLVLVSAANVDNYDRDHLTNSDLAPIEDPGQSWNALTIGAYTDLTQQPQSPVYQSFTPLAAQGELSPHSRTSMLFISKAPLKPEICLEGGNVLMDPTGFPEPKHPLLSLRTTSNTNNTSLTSANATSAATAQAARLAAMTMARYPTYWPETVRGLLVHAARWTPAMHAHFTSPVNSKPLSKTDIAQMMRRYGWGVPTETTVLSSSTTSVTMVVQDQLYPFDASFKIKDLRLHQMPWPTQVLQTIGDGEVTVRITLSYFIEPSATRRGWAGRYSYASHGLRFDLQGNLETEEEFLQRINNLRREEETGGTASTHNSEYSERWLLGTQARNRGSLHQDEWSGTGAALAGSSQIAVFPVGGWWKNNRRTDRMNMPVRYSLIVSLSTDEQGVDLYTPIATQLGITVPGTAIVI